MEFEVERLSFHARRKKFVRKGFNKRFAEPMDHIHRRHVGDLGQSASLTLVMPCPTNDAPAERVDQPAHQYYAHMNGPVWFRKI